MIQGEIYINATDVRRRSRRKNKLRDPAADHHDVIPVFTEQVHELQQNGPRRLNLIRGIVTKRHCHVGLMTSSMIAEAASSPRPLVLSLIHI